MSGNVGEWCEDGWNYSYEGAPADGSAWSEGSSELRVLRGGGFYSGARASRSAYRKWGRHPDRHFVVVDEGYGSAFGLRVVRTIDNPSPEVRSVSIGSFSLARVGQGGSVFNSGSVVGSASTTVGYHWMTQGPDGSIRDSGPLWVYMATGTAAIPAYAGFPTDLPGRYRTVLRVTSPLPARDSSKAIYTVMESGPPEITLDIPGLPEDATPLVVVRIPAGSFMMGRSLEEPGSSEEEDPLHRVNVGYDFYIGKYELTQAQWQAVVGTTPWEESPYAGPNRPASASWYSVRDASGLLARLNALGPGTFRLPSEAEWEYACRAGTTTRFYWGNDPDETEIGDYAWYFENALNVGERYAHAVGLKRPNAFGLYDMSGNVGEWCEDAWNSDYEGAPADGSAWTVGNTDHRVVRGGTYYSRASQSRSAYRSDVSWTSGGIGVRVVWTP